MRVVEGGASTCLLVLGAHGVGAGVLTAHSGKPCKASAIPIGSVSMISSAVAILVKKKNRHRPRMATVVLRDPMLRMGPLLRHTLSLKVFFSFRSHTVVDVVGSDDIRKSGHGPDSRSMCGAQYRRRAYGVGIR